MSPKIRTFIIALTLLICALMLCAQSASADQLNDSNKYTFANYGGEEFTPQPMEFGANLVDGTIPDLSEYNETERRHVYIQFYSTPTLEQRKMLENYGVQFVRGIGIHAFIVSMPADLTSADLPAESGLRWMGEILAENKYDSIFGLNVPEWAWTEDGQVILGIQFYDDVTYEEAEIIANKYSTSKPEFEISYNFLCSIITSENNITLIASEDNIQQLMYPTPDPVPDDESTMNSKSSPGFEFTFSALIILCAMLYYKKN